MSISVVLVLWEQQINSTLAPLISMNGVAIQDGI
jgi:hypothetical protein